MSYVNFVDLKDNLILELKSKIYELSQNNINCENLSYEYKKLEYE